MTKRKVGRPILFPGETIVYEAFKLPKSLKDRFNELAHKFKHNKSEILRTAIEDYIAENEEKESA